ncbi:hypothetical protein [Embleya sp. AB8]|uniref:hypothetical protein n=1 Tax=Embleya sp. AB8 TaxID=3156304 RepID=UPI003C7495EE
MDQNKSNVVNIVNIVNVVNEVYVVMVVPVAPPGGILTEIELGLHSHERALGCPS